MKTIVTKEIEVEIDLPVKGFFKRKMEFAEYFYAVKGEKCIEVQSNEQKSISINTFSTKVIWGMHSDGIQESTERAFLEATQKASEVIMFFVGDGN
jgi:hypothetical protein